MVIIGKSTFTILDVISQFNSKKENSKFNSAKKLKDITDAIIDEINKNPKADLKTIKNNLLYGNVHAQKFTGKWNDGFHKLFIFEDILEAKDNQDLEIILRKFFNNELSELIDVEESLKPNSVYIKMAEDIKQLIDSVPKTMKFYYSVPILPDGEKNIKVNPLSSGLGGFNNPYYDRFIIKTIVETPNLMIPLSILTNLISTNSSEPVAIKPKPEPIISKSEPVSEIVTDKITTWNDLRTLLNKKLENSDNDETKENHLNARLQILELTDEFLSRSIVEKLELSDNLKNIFDSNGTTSLLELFVKQNPNIHASNKISIDEIVNWTSIFLKNLEIPDLKTHFADFYKKLLKSPDGLSESVFIIDKINKTNIKDAGALKIKLAQLYNSIC